MSENKTTRGKRGEFAYENSRDRDNLLECVAWDGNLTIAVSDEKSYDSYNMDVTCAITLERKQAERLRDWLVEMLT